MPYPPPPGFGSCVLWKYESRTMQRKAPLIPMLSPFWKSDSTCLTQL